MNLILIYQAVTAVLVFVLAFFVLSKNFKNPVNISYFVFCLFVIGFNCANFLLEYSTTQQLDVNNLLFAYRLAAMFGSLTAPAVVCFAWFFPTKSEGLDMRKIIFAYLLGITSAVLSFTDYYIPGVAQVIDGVRHMRFGPLYYAFGIFPWLFVFYALKELVQKFRKAMTKTEKSQILFVFWGILLGYVVALSFNLDIPILWTSRFEGLGPLGPIFLVVCIAYAITKHELMDIRVAITRTVAYGIVTLLLVASFFGLNILSLPVTLVIITNALLGLFWAFAAHRLRAFIQTPLEEKWITGWYDPGKLLNRIAQRLVPVMEREAVFKTVAEELKSAIKIKNVDIKMGKQDTSYQDVTQIKNGVVIPLSSSDGVEGLIVLSQKVSEDPYNEKDLTLLRTIMLQTLAVFDRIRPYENIKKNFEANQKQLYDTEKLLARSEKIASMAGLIQEYNHQIKTPLGIVRGRIETLFDKTRDIEYMQKMQKIIMEQIDRANYIVESTLRLSQPREHQEIELDLNEMVNSALDLFPPGGVHLVKELNPVPKIKGDREDLQTLFINLIKNAVEAMPKGGELKIATYSTEEDGKPVVSAEVSDTGVGIPQENMEKIFEPFFSTNVTKGRGLGLSIVFRIVREHLGRINVKSQVGKGSTFMVKLPAKA